jgi:hypothetical protein
MGRCSVFEFDELFEPFGLCFGEGLPIAMGLGTAHDGNDGDEENFLNEMVTAFNISLIVNVVDGEEKGVSDAFDRFFVAVGFDDVFNNFFPLWFAFLCHFALPLVEKGRL